MLADLDARGIKLRLDGDALRFTAPAGALTPDLRTRLQALKPALVAHLRAAAAGPLPASLGQRRFWQLQRLDPAASFYNVPFLFHLSGPLDPLMLRRSVDAVVARHDSLRTTLHEQDGALVQRIAPAGASDWHEADTRDARDPEAAARDLLRQDMLRPYDLARDPALRATLVRTGRDAHLFQVCVHNVVFDMSSMLVILDEISWHAAAFAEGTDPALPAPVQYADYTRWQADRVAAGADKRRAYWTNWLSKGEPPSWSWPACQAKAASADFDSLPTWARLDPAQHAALQAFSRSCGVTVYIAMLTAYLQATRALTGAADITIGTTYSDRDDARFGGMVGASVMVPALRADMTDDPPTPALLLRVKGVVADALTHQDLPIEEVLPRDAKGPLFKLVCSAFAQTPHGRLLLPGVRAAWQEDWWNPVSRPTLYLVTWETPAPGGTALTCHMMHRRDVWDAATAQRMMGAFNAALLAMIAPATPGKLP